MYLWNIKALATKLKTGELSQAERFKYLFLSVILVTLAMEASAYEGKISTAISITESIMFLMITVGGTLLCYRANKKGDNKEFADRIICLSIPISLKVGVFFIGIYAVYFIAGYIALGDTFEQYTNSTTWIDVFFALLAAVTLYWLLIEYIGWVSGNRSSSEACKVNENQPPIIAVDGQKPKEPLLAIMLSCVFYGLGHIYAGSKKVGLTILAAYVGLLLLVFGWAVHPTAGLSFLVPISGKEGTLLVVVGFIGLIIHLFILIDAYRSAKRYNSENNLERNITAGKRTILILGIILCSYVLNLYFPLALGIRTYVVQAFKIPSGAMRLTLIEGDRLFVDKSAYKNSAPQRGDIAVFVYPKDDTRDFIKRVIGLPGESLEIREGKILINGQKLSSSPIISNFYYDNKGPNAQPGMVIDIPDGHYFVLGDNSQSSSDSRFWGFVPKENFIGRAFKIYYPFNRSGPLQ